MRFLPLIWRNLARSWLRSALTTVAIALAIMLVCLLLSMPGGLDRILDDLSSNTRIVVHNSAGLLYPLPYSYLGKVRALPGVTAAASWTWFGGVVREEKGVEFPNFAVEPEPFGVVWEDWGLEPQALKAFQRNRDAALVGLATMRSQRWKVGDLVTLESTVVPLDLTFRIVGVIDNDQAPYFFFHREYLAQALEAVHLAGAELLGVVWVRVDGVDRVGPLMQQIDDTFRNSEAETASETERSYFTFFFAVLEGFVAVILIVTSLVALCIVFISANTASMSIREQMGEIAVMKALGFSRRLVFGILLGEAVLLAAIGGALGAGAALALTWLLRARAAGWNPQLGPLGSFIVSDAILLQGLCLALVVGVVAGVVPALGAARRPVAQTLREVF